MTRKEAKEIEREREVKGKRQGKAVCRLEIAWTCWPEVLKGKDRKAAETLYGKR